MSQQFEQLATWIEGLLAIEGNSACSQKMRELLLEKIQKIREQPIKHIPSHPIPRSAFNGGSSHIFTRNWGGQDDMGEPFQLQATPV